MSGNNIEIDQEGDVEDVEDNCENPKETLQQLTADLNRLDEQEKDAKKSSHYEKYRLIFLMQSTLLGISYSIVWPVLWIYVKEDFNLTLPLVKLVYGLAFVAYPIASILSACIVERSSMSTKSIILMLGGAEIFGNFLFALNFHPALVVIGRFVAGLGDAFYVVLMRDTKARHGHARNEAMTMECLAAFILGVILSPGINVLTSFIPFKILSWHVTAYNYPGLSVALLFIIMQFIVLFFLPETNETEVSVESAHSPEHSICGNLFEWGYKAIFIAFYSFLYTYIVAFFEIAIPMIIYENIHVNTVGAMLLYAVIGTLYAMILMLSMTINLNNQLEASIGVSVLAKTAGLFGILYLGFTDKQLENILSVGAIVVSLAILWSTDDVLFINLVRVVIPTPQREYTHNLRKTVSKFSFVVAAVTAPFCITPSIFIVVGSLLVLLVYLCFCFFVLIRFMEENKGHQSK